MAERNVSPPPSPPQVDMDECQDTTCSFSNDVTVYGKPQMDQLMNWIVVEIPGEWEAVGIQLKISTDKLDGIKGDTSLAGNPKNMLREVMKLWKRNPHPEAPYNWATILNILATPSVGRLTLAHEVAGKIKPLSTSRYYTGGDVKKLCGCGKCSLKDIITKGCSRPDATSRFPILDITSLPPCKSRQYEYILMREADKINDSFGELVDDISESMCQRQVNFQRVKIYLNGRKLFSTNAIESTLSDLQRQLDEANDIRGVFVVLSKITSWFNHHPLGLLVRRYGSVEDKEAYRKFTEENVMTYLRRSVTEIPKDALSPGIDGSGQFRLKIDHPSSHEHITGGQVNTLTFSIAEVLDIPMECLTLCSIEEGCIELVFRASNVCYRAVFFPSLTFAYCKKLEEIAVDGPNDIPLKITGIWYDKKYHQIPVPPEVIFFASLYDNLPNIVVNYENASKEIQGTFKKAKKDLDNLEKKKGNKVEDVKEIKEFFVCLEATKSAIYQYLESVSNIPKIISENSDSVKREIEKGEKGKLKNLQKQLDEGLKKSETLHKNLTDQCRRLVSSCNNAVEESERRKTNAQTAAAVGGAAGLAASIGLGLVTFGIGSAIVGGATVAAAAITAAIILYFTLAASTFKDIGQAFSVVEERALLVQLLEDIKNARRIQLKLANEGLETILVKMQVEADKGHRVTAEQLEITRRTLWS